MRSSVRNAIVLLVGLGLFGSEAFAQNGTWTSKAPLPSPRVFASGGGIDGLFYVAGGVSQDNTPAATLAYDPMTDTWSYRADMVSARSYPGVAVGDGKMFLAGGNDGITGETNTLQIYDAVANTWSVGMGMSTARSQAGAGFIGDLLYVAGGSPGNCFALSSLEVYSPETDSWTTKASMPTARFQVASGVINGKLYVAGGAQAFACGPGGIVLDKLEIYDPVTDTWVTKAPMPAPRTFPVGAVHNGVFYVIGGVDVNGQTVTSVEAYDPMTDTWTTRAQIPTARQGAAAGAVNGILYVVGGANAEQPILATNEAFTPPVIPFIFTGFFAPVDNLPTLNRVKAGSAVPVKFSLSGNQGPSIFSAGFPASAVTMCTSADPVDAIEETTTAGSSSLSYDASTDQYIYVWKTNKAWAGTCRQLVIELTDGTAHRANFQLTK